MTEAYEDPHHFAKRLREGIPLLAFERRDLARLLEAMAREIATWHACALQSRDGKPNGFRRSLLERCREEYIKPVPPIAKQAPEAPVHWTADAAGGLGA